MNRKDLGWGGIFKEYFSGQFGGIFFAIFVGPSIAFSAFGYVWGILFASFF